MFIPTKIGGTRNRTVDLLRAKQMLYQLSNTPCDWVPALRASHCVPVLTPRACALLLCSSATRLWLRHSSTNPVLCTSALPCHCMAVLRTWDFVPALRACYSVAALRAYHYVVVLPPWYYVPVLGPCDFVTVLRTWHYVSAPRAWDEQLFEPGLWDPPVYKSRGSTFKKNLKEKISL